MCCGMFLIFNLLPVFFILGGNPSFLISIASQSTWIELLVLFIIVCNTICIPWCLFQKAPAARADASVEMKIPPQSYPIELPVGPPDAVELSFDPLENAHEENHE